ncbi:MAG: hypothetical protein IPG88_15900, partial [Gemmatimonadetes bacterium]|nr:hypothetical protein [Gemmatimonadota bacterium]
PDQNFTYIVALKPRMAFIVDIRRGNLLQHLMYKALIERSTDRADFLSQLFSRPRPAAATTEASVTALFAAYDSVAADTAMFRTTLESIRRRTVDEHRFALSADDLSGISTSSCRSSMPDPRSPIRSVAGRADTACVACPATGS